MRTAIMLLFALAAAASIGSFIPQRPINELAVIRWKAMRPGLGAFFERIGFFDVYGAGWFTAIYTLLLVSLVGCLVPRYRAFWRVWRATPKPGARGAHTFEGVAACGEDEAIDIAERSLRRRRYRTARIEGGVAAERGHWREGGSLMFHTAFLVLLVGVAVGKGWGFNGQVAIVEGDRFTETHVAYDSINEGSRFGERHRGFTLAVEDFNATFADNGVPKEFVSRVKLFEGDQLVRDTDIRVNNPLVYRGVSIFQLAWGWAPRIVIEAGDGTVLHDAPVVFLPDGGGWRGVVKVPQTKPEQIGLEMYFFNDLKVDERGRPRNVSPLPNRPFVFFQEYRGDLNLSAPQSVYEIDKRKMKPGDIGAVALNASETLPGGYTISFPGLRQYTVFQIAADPGQAVVLAAAALILVGLFPSLYSSRRRVWVRVRSSAAAGGEPESRVELSGLALQRKASFEEEFGAIVRDLGRQLGGGGAR